MFNVCLDNAKKAFFVEIESSVTSIMNMKLIFNKINDFI